MVLLCAVDYPYVIHSPSQPVSANYKENTTAAKQAEANGLDSTTIAGGIESTFYAVSYFKGSPKIL